jgi:hypothetical protein
VTGDGATRNGAEALLMTWWAQRRELRPCAWQVPFPAGGGAQARVLQLDSAVDGKAVWRAALFRPHALTAFIEVERPDGPIAALRSLYQHVGPDGEAHRAAHG